MPGVRVFVMDEFQRVLLVKSNYAKRSSEDEFWVAPGGGIDFGEFSIDAGIREVNEETGIQAEITHLLWIVEEKRPDGSMNYANYFLGRAVGGTLKVGFDPELPEDKQVLLDVAFFSRDEILNLGRVYPEVLLDEFWDILNNLPNHDVYRRRPARGFGIRTSHR